MSTVLNWTGGSDGHGHIGLEVGRRGAGPGPGIAEVLGPYWRWTSKNRAWQIPRACRGFSNRGDKEWCHEPLEYS